MKNSVTAGLNCDLFISHAWDEGVFDLEANLMKAWPTELEGAYFCCLSNPQNQPQLMAELLKTVVHSPFYQVLTAAPEQVLLLSNLNTPIHSRLWCVFEAHCANEMNIEVRLAGPAVGLITNSQRLAWVKCGLSWISILSGPFFLFSGLAPLLLGWMFLISLFSGSASYIAFSALYFVISLVVVLGTCYACNKANGMRNHAASFSLDVQNATCTSNKDTKMIREAIGGKEQAINAQIRKLIAESGIIADLQIGGRGRRTRPLRTR